MGLTAEWARKRRASGKPYAYWKEYLKKPGKRERHQEVARNYTYMVKDKIKAYNQEWRKRPAVKEREKENNRRYKHGLKGKEYIKIYNQAYASIQMNKDRSNARRRQRRDEQSDWGMYEQKQNIIAAKEEHGLT